MSKWILGPLKSYLQQGHKEVIKHNLSTKWCEIIEAKTI